MENKENKNITKMYPSSLHHLMVCGAVKGNMKLIKECFSRNVDLSHDVDVAIRLASQKGFVDIVEYLVLQGGDIEQAKIHGTKSVKIWIDQYCCSTNVVKNKI